MPTTTDFLDPLIDNHYKGFPHHQAPLRRSQIGAQGWNVLRGDLPLPLAVIRQDALAGNLAWLQNFARERGLDLAPHGKTTMAPQLFSRQLQAGAWGITFANVQQARIGLLAGAQRCIIANQVLNAVDLEGIQGLLRESSGRRILFLVDSTEQIALIDQWYAAYAQKDKRPFEVLLEMGMDGGRTGCRNHATAQAVARAARASAATRLVGIECFEGLWAKGDDTDRANADDLMGRLTAIAQEADREGWFECDEVIMSAGGSAIFDLVAVHLRPQLSRPVRGILRSGCYVTHDHGGYQRMMNLMSERLGCAHGLNAALEVWTSVQSRPEPGLAILTAGKRDASYDGPLPRPIHWAPRGAQSVTTAPAHWSVTAMNDQHAYLRVPEGQTLELQVGDRVALGISHPCTTFDKWRWMVLVDEAYNVRDALVTCF